MAAHAPQTTVTDQACCPSNEDEGIHLQLLSRESCLTSARQHEHSLILCMVVCKVNNLPMSVTSLQLHQNKF